MKKLHLAVWLLIATTTFAQPEKLKATLDNYLQQYHETRQLSGVVLIGMQGRTMYKKVLGWKAAKAGTKLTGSEKFGIGSCTKLFTALLVMQQVEKGEIKLDDPLAKWLPETKIAGAGKITVKHLLQHTAGLGNYMAHPMYGRLLGFGKIKTTDDLLSLVEEMPLKQEPGTAYNYSNSGYILLGKIIEKATGLPYRQLLQQQILLPLHLKDSYTEMASSDVTLAQPYRFVDDKHFIHFPAPDTIRCFPDGGLLMSADDLVRFANALLNNQVVKPATWQQMISDTVRTDRKGGYGLGVVVEDINGKKWIGHDGFSRGYSADLKIIPEEKGILVSLFNNNGVSSVQINTSIIGIIDGKEPGAPKTYVWKVAHELSKTSPQLVLADVNTFVTEKGYAPFTSAMQIISITNDLDEAGLANISFELLHFNLHLFPNEAVSYKALAEAYALKKDKPKAIETFKQALKISPSDEYTNRRLKELEAL